MPEISFDPHLPAPRNLKPEENAYAAIKEFEANIPANDTQPFKSYTLRLAYLGDTTNRLALAGEAHAFIAAESNTIAVQTSRNQSSRQA